MSGKEIFGVVVRSGGYYLILYGLYQALGAISPFPNFDASTYLKSGLPVAGFGLIVLAGANVIVDFAYRQSIPTDDGTDDAE